MVQRLQARGVPLELTELVGQPNDRVLEALVDADMVVDQLYSDFPMAGFAAEAASLGRPALVGGYDSHSILARLPKEARPPTVFCPPDAIEDAVVHLTHDAIARRDLGSRAFEFVRDRWSAASVAERYQHLFRGDIPGEWWRDPGDVDMLHGACLSEHRARALIRAVVERGGPDALQLADKPPLEAAMLAFGGVSRGDDDTP